MGANLGCEGAVVPPPLGGWAVGSGGGQEGGSFASLAGKDSDLSVLTSPLHLTKIPVTLRRKASRSRERRIPHPDRFEHSSRQTGSGNSRTDAGPGCPAPPTGSGPGGS